LFKRQASGHLHSIKDSSENQVRQEHYTEVTWLNNKHTTVFLFPHPIFLCRDRDTDFKSVLFAATSETCDSPILHGGEYENAFF
jgi:hypothetical protein